MIRTTALRTLAIGLTTGSMLVLAACGGDMKVSVTSQKPVTTQASATTSGSGGSGSGTTAPMGTGSSNSSSGGGGNGMPSAECLKFAQAWAAAIGGASTGGTNDASVFDALVKSVPDNLKADAKLLADTYGKYLSILKSYNGDITKAMADPAVQKALKDLGSPEVSAAQQHITDYFDQQCPKG